MALGKLKWLIVGIAIALVAVLALSITLICTKHTHEFVECHFNDDVHFLVCPYDEVKNSSGEAHIKVWDYNEEYHWYKCSYHSESYECAWNDIENAQPHEFDANGVCECGYQRP